MRTKEVSRIPSAPFITSSFQMEASRKLGLGSRRAMVLAQQLYERGFITYMRTDSTTMSQEAIAEAGKMVRNSFGPTYWHGRYKPHDKKAKGAQEAHECIRPTEMSRNATGDRGADPRRREEGRRGAGQGLRPDLEAFGGLADGALGAGSGIGRHPRHPGGQGRGAHCSGPPDRRSSSTASPACTTRVADDAEEEESRLPALAAEQPVEPGRAQAGAALHPAASRVTRRRR